MKSHRPSTWLLYVVGLVLVVMTGLWVISMVIGLLFKLFLVALVVVGAVYLFGRSNRRLDNKGPRALGR